MSNFSAAVNMMSMLPERSMLEHKGVGVGGERPTSQEYMAIAPSQSMLFKLLCTATSGVSLGYNTGKILLKEEAKIDLQGFGSGD